MSKQKLTGDATISKEWLEGNGFEKDEFGYRRNLANGPDKTELAILIGTFPWNSPCICITIGGFTFSTAATKKQDIETMIRLFDGQRIDHPYIEDVFDPDDYDDPDEGTLP